MHGLLDFPLPHSAQNMFCPTFFWVACFIFIIFKVCIWTIIVLICRIFRFYWSNYTFVIKKLKIFCANYRFFNCNENVTVLKKKSVLQRQTMVKLNGIDEFFVTVQQLTYMKPRQSACFMAKAPKMIDQILLL